MSETVWTELEKIDILRERMGLTYEEARTVLLEAEGELIKALAQAEKGSQSVTEDLKEQGQEMWEGFNGKLKKLHHTRVNVKHHEKTVFSISAPLGLVLAYSVFRRPGLRMLGLLGLGAAALHRYKLEVESSEEVPVPAVISRVNDEAAI
ncbi:MAG: DUF4342 domain-containing protein [Desulfitobacteriaceae bacterium]